MSRSIETSSGVPAQARGEVPALVVEHRRLLLVSVLASMAMNMLDTTIANVALPHMQSSLQATQDTVTWVITSYVLAAAVALPLAGWLVDTFGIRTVMVISVAVFTFASALCGAAHSLEQMVLFRVLQGVAGAFLQPLSLTLLLDVSTPRERPKMMTLFSQVLMIAPIDGPLLGGYITEHATWRWVFYVNVPIGILCLGGLLASLPEGHRRFRKFDKLGWLFVALAVASMQLMLDRGSTKDWFSSFEILSYLVICLCAAWLAVVHVSTTKDPIFPTRLFADFNFVTGLTITFLYGMIAMSSMALLPQLFQNVFGFPVMETGMLMVPRGLGMLLSMTLFSRLTAQMDPRVTLAIGLSVQAVTLWMMTGWTSSVPASTIVLVTTISGMGNALTFIPLNMLMYTTLAHDLRTDASSFSSLIRNLGSSLGVSICTVLLTHSVQVNHEEIGSRFSPPDLPFDLTQLPDPDLTVLGLRLVDGMVNREALMIGYINDFMLMSIACAVCIPLLMLMKRPPRLVPVSSEELARDMGH